MKPEKKTPVSTKDSGETTQQPQSVSHSLRDVELRIADIWEKEGIFQKSVQKRRRGKPFVFFDGLASANGVPHLGHFLTRIYKDLYGRYKTMQGFYAPRRAGWDTHGLPVELEIEKELGLKNKKDIETYGIAAFNRKCRESVWKYKKAWEDMTKRIGFWIDLDHAYVTYKTDYVESLWSILGEVWKKGLLYQGHKVIPFCTRCGTGLSSHEVAQGYKDVVDASVYVKFRLAPGQDIKGIVNTDLPIYVIAWTTTPWTLPGNVALAVGDEIKYSIVNLEATGDVVIVATDRLSALGSEYKVLGELKGKNLTGLSYEPLFKIPELKNDASYKIYAAPFVTTSDGSGVVHTAVMYGEDDYALGKEYALPMIHTVSEQGVFQSMVPHFAGKPARATNGEIIEYLKGHGAVYRVENYEHSYPHCWRCKTPLLYYAKSSWFIAMSKLRKQLVERNKTVSWNPEHIGDGRFGEFIKEAKDWALSRERYWGTPLPLWKCSGCGAFDCVSAFEELEARRPRKKNQYYLVRHGVSTKTKDDIVASRIGHDRYDLTDFGMKKTKAAARELRLKGGLDMIFSSPFRRTMQTAELYAVELGLSVTTDERLKEIDHGGALEGRRHSECTICHKNVSLDARLFDGETRREVKARMMNFVRECEQKYEGKKIMIVSHGDPLWMLESAMRLYSDDQTSSLKDKIYPREGDIHKLSLPNYPYDESGAVDPHRPYIDQVEISCRDCGSVMKRVPDLIDVWFDSGAMPYAQWHYPFENKKVIDGKGNGVQYPADFIVEAVDQTRGWFYTLLAISALLDRPAPYRNVSVLGFVTNDKGKKLSKSEGAGEGFAQFIASTSVDALRWHLYTLSDVGDDKRFAPADVETRARAFHGTVLNMARFFELYRGKKTLAVTRKVPAKNLLDAWIIARCQATLREVTQALDSYQTTQASRAVESFVVNDLSQWWLRLSRPRFQHPKTGAELVYVSKLFLYIWTEVAKMIAPFNPFFAEYLFENLKLSSSMQRSKSIHMTDWSSVKDASATDERLMNDMIDVRAFVATGLSQRKLSQIKVRQPLASVTLKRHTKLHKDLEHVIRSELNVKSVLYDDTIDTLTKLDEVLTQELMDEGAIREMIRCIQDARKELGCDFHDKITVGWWTSDDKIGELVERNKREIMAATLVKEFKFSKEPLAKSITKECKIAENVSITFSAQFKK